MLFRSRLIFGAIKRIISGVLTSIYKVLSLFNLQFTLLLACIGAVLYLTGALNASSVLLVIYLVLLVGSIGYAVIKTLRKFFRLDKKKADKKRPKNMQIIEAQPTRLDESISSIQPSQDENYNVAKEPIRFEQEKPKYFKVKGHPDYIMAEYSDRYELFKVSNGQMIKIRTDYKY